MSYLKDQLDKEFKEVEEQQALLKMNYFDRFLKYHSDTFGEAVVVMYIIESLVALSLYCAIMLLHASGNIECYYEQGFYNGDTAVVASINWREDRKTFHSDDYSEVKEYLIGKEMCE